MRKITRKGDVVSYRELPVFEWIVLGGAGLLFATLALQNGTGLARLIYFVAGLALLWRATSRPVTLVRIDGDRRTLTHRRQSLLSHKFEMFDLKDLSEPFAVQARGARERPQEYLLMKVKDREPFVLARPNGYGEEWTDLRLTDVAAMLNGAIPEFAARPDVMTLPVP